MEEKEEISIMTFVMKLADRVIRIHAMHDYIKEYSKGYVLSKQGKTSEDTAIDFEITVTSIVNADYLICSVLAIFFQLILS